MSDFINRRINMNPNDTVKIKPTEEGWRQIVKYVDEANDKLKMHPKVRHRMAVPVPDAEGYISGQFWALMQYFDWNSVLAAGDILFHDMQIPPKHARRAEHIARQAAKHARWSMEVHVQVYNEAIIEIAGNTNNQHKGE